MIAPGGATFVTGEMFPEWEGDLMIGSLFPGGLVRLAFDADGYVVEEERLLRNQVACATSTCWMTAQSCS